jgi:Uma2 family endonuclease
MPETKIKIGPADHGQRMTLAEFEFAEVEPGHRYELSRGVVIVSDVALEAHGGTIDDLRMILYLYRHQHPGIIHRLASGTECKLLVPETESERHPDISLYLTPPPRKDNTVWRIWIPGIVIEVVSRLSRLRDYEQKKEDYLAIGIREYWIVNEETKELVTLKKHGSQWRERVLKPGEVYETRLLPGFQLNVAELFG